MGLWSECPVIRRLIDGLWVQEAVVRLSTRSALLIWILDKKSKLPFFTGSVCHWRWYRSRSRDGVSILNYTMQLRMKMCRTRKDRGEKCGSLQLWTRHSGTRKTEIFRLSFYSNMFYLRFDGQFMCHMYIYRLKGACCTCQSAFGCIIRYFRRYIVRDCFYGSQDRKAQ